MPPRIQIPDDEFEQLRVQISDEDFADLDPTTGLPRGLNLPKPPMMQESIEANPSRPPAEPWINDYVAPLMGTVGEVGAMLIPEFALGNMAARAAEGSRLVSMLPRAIQPIAEFMAPRVASAGASAGYNSIMDWALENDGSRRANDDFSPLATAGLGLALDSALGAAGEIARPLNFSFRKMEENAVSKLTDSKLVNDAFGFPKMEQAPFTSQNATPMSDVVLRNRGEWLDPSVVGARDPFAGIGERLYGRPVTLPNGQRSMQGGLLDATGQEIDGILQGTQGGITLGELFNSPASLQARTGLTEAASTRGAHQEFFEREWQDELSKFMPVDEVTSYAATRTAVERAVGELNGPRPLGVARRDELRNIIATGRAQLQAVDDVAAQRVISAPELFARKRAYGELGFGDGGTEQEKGFYRNLADTSRDRLVQLANNPDLEAAMTRYSDMERFRPYLANRFEGSAGITNPPVQMVGGTQGRLGLSARFDSFLGRVPAEERALRMAADVDPRGGGFMGSIGRVGQAVTEPGVTAPAGNLLNFDPMSWQTAPAQAEERAPTNNVVGINSPSNSFEVRPNDKPGFKLPRALRAIQPEGIAQILLATDPVNGPMRVDMWDRIVESGDIRQQAQFLSALYRENPHFPLQVGQVTGMGSEFDIGDGKARLFDEMDKAQWLDVIERSALREDEKARRIAMLNADGVVVPMDRKLVQFEPEAPKSPADAALERRAPSRVRTPMGLKRLEF